MNSKQQLFINTFQKGSSENSNLGTGALIGIDTYTKKGVTLLARRSSTVKDFSSTTHFPHFFCFSALGTTLWTQLDNGDVWYSTNDGVTWTDSTFPATGTDRGCGLIHFQGYVFAFIDTKVYYHSGTGSVGGWTDWTTAKTLGALAPTSFTNPIKNLHFPFLFPSQRGVYFGNASALGSVGFFGQVGTTIFDPTGANGVDFIYNNSIFSLPSNTYIINSLDFLPPANLAITAYAFQNPQSAALITWDTISSSKFSPPLSLFSNTQNTSTGIPLNSGVKQVINRNQILYTITGGNHTIYETNGSTFNLVEDIALYSNIRSSNGGETNLPVFFDSYPQAICVLGNKLLTGVSSPADNTYLTSGLGIFPMGIWSIAFNPDGSKSTQTEFTLPVGGTTSPSGSGNFSKITCIIPMGNGRIAFGYAVKTAGVLSSGVAITNISNFQANSFIESELFEIGTALVPQTINNIEINLIKPLGTGQSITTFYRTAVSQDWTSIDVWDGNGGGLTDNTNYHAITSNPIGATQYIQLKIFLNIGGGGADANSSIEIRNIIIS